MKKDEMLKMLRDNETYRQVLSLATDDKERQLIKAYTEDFLLKFYRSVAEPAVAARAQDPDILNKTYQKLSEELINSGSTDKEDGGRS